MTRAKDISKIVTDADLSGTLDVTGDLSVDNATLKVDSTNNRVGIGISSPSALLQVVGADGVNGGAIMYSASGVASGYMSADAAGLCLATDTAGITFRTGISPVDPTDTGSERMRITSAGNVGIGNSSPTGILSTLSNDNGVVFQTSASANKRMQLFFQDNAGTNTARIGNDISGGNTSELQFIAGSGSTPQVTLNSSGNVSIGKTTPLSKLDVTGGFITVSKDANSAGRIGASEYITGSTDNDLVIQATGSGVTKFYQVGVNSLNITSGGNVGIGTASPSAKLDVAGGLTVSGDVTLGNGATLNIDDQDSILFGTYSGGTSGTLLQGGTSTDYSVRVAGKLRQNISTGGDISFYEDTGTTAKLFWDASEERLGIGTTSPSTVLHAVGTGQSVRMQNSSGTSKYIQMRSDSTNSHIEHIGGPADALRINNQASGTIEFLTNNTERMRITSAGRVGIGISVGTSYHFQVNNSSSSSVVAYFMATSGVGVYLSNGANSWSTASDETLKENINELDKQKSYDNIKNIRAVNYKYIADEDDDTKRIGFIAQDWQTKYPEMIVSDAKDNDKLGLNYTETIPVLLSALQKAQEKIEALEARIVALETA